MLKSNECLIFFSQAFTSCNKAWVGNGPSRAIVVACYGRKSKQMIPEKNSLLIQMTGSAARLQAFRQLRAIILQTFFTKFHANRIRLTTRNDIVICSS
eukprot:g51534.t1